MEQLINTKIFMNINKNTNETQAQFKMVYGEYAMK